MFKLQIQGRDSEHWRIPDDIHRRLGVNMMPVRRRIIIRRQCNLNYTA
jgi:hypothetical protein